MTDLLERINSGDATATEVSDLIASDPGLIAHMLKVINSAYYGLPRQITDIKHAVAYLGFGEIHRIVLTVAVMQSLEPKDRDLFMEFWSHSFFTALVSKKVTRAFERSWTRERSTRQRCFTTSGNWSTRNFSRNIT
jgi:HD-like signal output (HDOD) protein